MVAHLDPSARDSTTSPTAPPCMASPTRTARRRLGVAHAAAHVGVDRHDLVAHQDLALGRAGPRSRRARSLGVGQPTGREPSWTSRGLDSVHLLGQCFSERWARQRRGGHSTTSCTGCCLASRWSRGTPGARSRRAHDPAPRRALGQLNVQHHREAEALAPLPLRLTSAVTAASKSRPCAGARRAESAGEARGIPRGKELLGVGACPLPPSSRGAATRRRGGRRSDGASLRPEAVAEAT